MSSKNKRDILFNYYPSHSVDEKSIQDALNSSKLNHWADNDIEGAKLGKILFDILNGTGGTLASKITEASDNDEILNIYLKLPPEISDLPFELINNGGFLLLTHKINIFRLAALRGKDKRRKPNNSPLKLLFMASSPQGVKPVLEYDKEEELILEKMGHIPVDITVEDSGSIDGLYDTLFEINGSDIVHMSGHATIDKDKNPVFCMEDETGNPDMVTHERLWEKLESFKPKMLFLSGCLTGKGDGSGQSFAYKMVQAGIPIVLGWGLSVYDFSATRMGAELYKTIAEGKGIAESIIKTRQLYKDSYHSWHILRAFTDESPLVPIVTPGQKLKYLPRRKLLYKFLGDSQVKVLETGFVGRRRYLQHGINILKGKEHNKFGLLIRGVAGVGKSTLSGKLVERFKDRELIVLHGEFSKVDILTKIRDLVERKKNEKGLNILKSDMGYNEQIKELMKDVFNEIPVIFLFDDFEPVLRSVNGEFRITPDALDAMRPLFYSVDWAEHVTNIIITSRYNFKLEFEGKRLNEKLYDMPLISFTGADLKKKTDSLENIAKSKNKKLYIEYGHGNPLLLEWLDIIAKDERKYDVAELETKLKDRNEDFVRDYLLDLITETEGEEFKTFINKSAVFRTPVGENAFTTYGDKTLLEKAVTMTFMEKEQIGQNDSYYWVTPVLRDMMWDKLDDAEKLKIHDLAYNWYDGEVEKSKENDTKPDPKYLEEALYHATKTDNIFGACKHAVSLGNHMKDLLIYRETASMQKEIAEKIDDAVIEKAIESKDSNVAVLLNDYGFILDDLGEYEKAKEYYEKALNIYSMFFDESHPSVKNTRDNLALTLEALENAKQGKGNHVYFKSLTFKNIRCFKEKQKLDLSANENDFVKWTIILGENGTGKTSLLWFLSQAASDINSRKSNQDLPKNVSYKVTGDFSKGVNIKMNCFAYGAGRRFSPTEFHEEPDKNASDKILVDNTDLKNPEEWLLLADYAAIKESDVQKAAIAKRDKVKEILINVLPDVNNIEINPDKTAPDRNEVKFHTPYGEVFLKDLSLGYKTMAAWMVDLTRRLFDLYPDSNDPLSEPAVVLVDEIDLHLHPAWQRELINFLNSRFTKTQFIVTSHSPLIVQGNNEANIVLLRKEGDHVVLDSSLKHISSWRVDQILTSDIFGLKSAWPKSKEELLNKRKAILSKSELSDDDEKRLEAIEEELGYLPVGETPRDIEAMDIIRKAADYIKKNDQDKKTTNAS
ncbi:MAG: AAA family ATPase [Nitrospirae bacterium]|nr:AAA family ATPase [Nitrospirota bacterium]